MGYRIFVALGLTFSVGLLDGLGLTMFLPLLKLVGGSEEVSGEDMGGMSFLVDGFSSIGIPLNLISVLLIMVVFFVLKGIATFVRGYYDVIVRLYFVRNLRFRNVEGMINFKYKSFVLADAGRIQNTMSGEVGRGVSAYMAYFKTM